MKCGEIETGPLIEEFMTLKGGKSDENGGVIKSIDCSEKKNWMSSVQLWSTNVQFHNFGHDFLSNLKSVCLIYIVNLIHIYNLYVFFFLN